ncbi:hypothetical protein LGL08_17695 [Clostridium estertheticum]|uniref:hypothetical protein n=1 Tax=Clostridium estertheticum TaxID=238834 RepID=UPI001CF285DA|nr:hypothetical protein [Clostridium estertheticum]MCB2307978.1 hypothetical protein [Clostridium estertheticum]MCB2346102.1 hypothetical protein [Clostridium estertheticum]MCB2351359.1 hypothetical protein [Clostridium estertheticum]WAG44245.1 hypothetical protein LL127_11720 [Clostridium estertheticum]
MKIKNLYYYFLQAIWYCLVSFIALTYWKRLGWAFVLAAFIILYIGDKLITKYFKPKS